MAAAAAAAAVAAFRTTIGHARVTLLRVERCGGVRRRVVKVARVAGSLAADWSTASATRPERLVNIDERRAAAAAAVAIRQVD